MYFINLNICLMISFMNMLTYSVIDSYSFCPNCIHFTAEINKISDIHSPKKPRCNLFKSHPLFKDRIDVDLIGKEICTIKGKYFIHYNETRLDNVTIFK
jgi:hypothetical protein